MTLTNDDTSFGTLLKTFRRRQHRTQQQLADTLGVHRSTLFRWERGDYLPESKAQVLELARVLSLDDQETRELLEASLTALAPSWHVPCPRNLYFTGREEILEALHTQLAVDHAGALTQSSALSGLGGVGKTQIALEYAYRYALEYHAVFWIGAETEEHVAASFLQIAEALQLPEREEKDQQRVIAAVQRWLRSHGQWLLIWDNIDDVTLLDRFLPSTRSGAILLTTRQENLGTLAWGLNLLPMKQEEGILFLLRRAKMLSPETTGEHFHHLIANKPGEYRAAAELVQVLGGLPLALDQAGAYVEETGCSLSGYLRRYEQHRSSLLAQRGGLSRAHPHSVAMTFKLLLERVEHEQPAAADVLRLCCVLHAEAIPEELFVDGAAHLGPALATVAADPIRFDQVIATLRNLSLVQRQPEMRTLSLHRLVQAVFRETLDSPAAHCWSERVIRALTAAFPDPNVRNWPRCERFVPHVQSVLQFAEQRSLSLPQARDLFARTGTYLLERGRYTEAERVLVRACAPGEHESQRNDLPTANLLDRLATLYWRQGKYQQAEPLFLRALALSEQCLGPTHPERWTYLNNVALLYYEQGNYEQAEMLQHRCLALAEDQLDALHPDLAQALDNLARIMAAQGKDTQAEALYQRALSIWESQLGSLHPNMAFCLSNLGTLYLEQGKYDLAEPCLQRALALRQHTLGETHPRTAISLRHLARLFLSQGKDEEALLLSQRAVFILEQPDESENFDLSRALETLGVVYLVQNNDERAESLLQRALAIQEQHLGPDHPETACTLHDLARVRRKQGKLAEALSFAERARSGYAQALGETHAKTVAAKALATYLLQEQKGAKREQGSPHEAAKRPDTRREGHHPARAALPLQEAIHPAPTENNPLQEFLDARCELHSRAWCRSADLWQAYEQWVEQQQERYPLSRTAFARQVKAAGCWTARTNRARIWWGITLVDQESVTGSDGQ